MKKIIYSLIFSMIALFGFQSCHDMLDVESNSSMEPATVFTKHELAESAIAGVIQSFCETNSYRGRFLVNYGINTDCEVYISLKDINNDKARLSNYNTNVANGQMNTSNNAWAKFYEGIERANLAIYGIKENYDYENDWEMSQYLGELITLRAVVYSDLLKAWGDVPARFEPLNRSEEVFVPRASRDVIYKQLLADLEEAAGLLGWPNENSKTRSTERCNKAFAKALRARLALAAGGYAQRMGEDGKLMNNGAPCLSPDPELAPDKMYAIAKQECLDIINSGTCKLQGFEEVFRTFHKEQYVAGQEILWEIPFSDGRGRVIFDLGVKHTNVDKYTGQAKGGADGPNPYIFYEYDVEDVRRDVSCVPYEWTNGIQVPTGANKFYFGKFRYEWLDRFVTSTNDDGLNWLYMRYADVLLMAAEAVNEIDGPSAAVQYLRPIVERAYPATKAEAILTSAAASREAFFEEIVDQRAFEFTGEMLRKGDLIRWNKLGSKLEEAKTALAQFENREGKYANLPEKIYYRTAEDGETVEIYGLNYGETDDAGVALGWETNKTWKLNSSTDLENQYYWNCLYMRNPDSQQYWPIWQVFVTSSEGKLNNDCFNVN